MRTMVRSKILFLFLAFGVMVATAAVAFADIIVNDIVAATGNDQRITYTVGQTNPAVVKYGIDNNGAGGLTSCDATSASPVYVKINLPTGVTATSANFLSQTELNSLPAAAPQSVKDGPTLKFTGCIGTDANGPTGYQAVDFHTTVAAKHTISVSFYDNAGEYNDNLATWFLVSDGSTGSGGGGGGGTQNTPPQVSVTGVADGGTYEINDVPTPGCSVTDAEDTGESATPQLSAISGLLAAYGLGTQTVTCSYTDGGGLPGSATATYTIQDTGNPVITNLGPTPANPDGLNGFYLSPVTNTFKAQDFNGTLPTPDNGAGFATTTPPLLQYNIPVTSGLNQEGNAMNPVVLASGSVSDVAGNTAASVNSANFKIDLFNPSLGNIQDNNAAVSNVCTSTSGAPSKPTGFNPTDTANGSGIDTANTGETWTLPPSTTFPFGTYGYEAHATDLAGRTATPYGPKSYVYNYGVGQGGATFNGPLQPINIGSPPRSVFKLGSTIPVKVQLLCGSTPITNAQIRLSVQKVDSTPEGAVNEAVATTTGTTGTLFRYDAASGQYIFNLSTKSSFYPINTWSQGTYKLLIDLGDGTPPQTAYIDVGK